MQLLYEDKQLVLYSEAIVINKYYFPLATSRTILFSEIEKVVLLPSEGVTQRWGLCKKYLNNWFPYDSQRAKKTKFIEIWVKGQRIRPSVTPEDPEKVFRLIWEHRTKEGHEYAERVEE